MTKRRTKKRHPRRPEGHVYRRGQVWWFKWVGADRRTYYRSSSATDRAVAEQIRSGQVHLNYPDWDPNAPFGGYKHSGNGREYGLEGMGEYLETKAVLGFYQ